MNFKVNPRKRVSGSINYVNVSFLLPDNAEEPALTQLKKNGKKFAYDPETTVRDLLQRISQFLADHRSTNDTNQTAEYGLFVLRHNTKKSEENVKGIAYLNFTFERTR